jgi:hypothetical protein
MAPSRYPHPLKSSAAELASRIQRLYGQENPLLQQQAYDLILGALRALRDEHITTGAAAACPEKAQ